MARSHWAFFSVADAFPMEIDKHQAMFRRYNRTFCEQSAGIYAQNRKASGSIACIIILFTIANAKIPNGTQALATFEIVCAVCV